MKPSTPVHKLTDTDASMLERKFTASDSKYEKELMKTSTSPLEYDEVHQGDQINWWGVPRDIPDSFCVRKIQTIVMILVSF